MNGKNTTEYAHIHAIVFALEAVFTSDQIFRVLKAAEMGGFEAGLKSLERVSAQIAAEKRLASQTHAYMEGKIIALESQVESQKERAAMTMKALETLPARFRAAEKAAPRVVNLLSSWDKRAGEVDYSAILIDADTTDNHDWNCAKTIANDLNALGHWDGHSPIRVFDPYMTLHRAKPYVTITQIDGVLVVRAYDAPAGKA